MILNDIKADILFPCPAQSIITQKAEPAVGQAIKS